MMSAVMPPSDQPRAENELNPRPVISCLALNASLLKKSWKSLCGGRDLPNPGGSHPIRVNSSFDSPSSWGVKSDTAEPRAPGRRRTGRGPVPSRT